MDNDEFIYAAAYAAALRAGDGGAAARIAGDAERRWFGTIAEALIRRGYRFVPLAEALRDPAYSFKLPPDYTVENSSTSKDPQMWSTAADHFRAERMRL